MNLSLLLFLVGIFGFVLNRKNIILMIISIEIMLLSITYLILINSLNFDDIIGQTFAAYIIAIAGAESAIGLGILVAFYRMRGSIAVSIKDIVTVTVNYPFIDIPVKKDVKKIEIRNYSISNILGTTEPRLSEKNYKLKYK
jgi:NADH-ubiquinone oxidoreductase chain 4L|uniref:NADH-ubiquinone oxidoreductase chain 4L n=2 Tax=Orbiliaceae TaxID=47021 RepID=A0A481ZNF4_ORBOL|nr:NADH dehydrogenase subunit 4L [Orbilia oligospora]YP_009574388.1 NADH dehydrogenase subunit 4L [Arthrobotrys musiformis]QBL01998.1 NADH dehydrogenase subunit 4L [Orbilia oligospora]QBM31506.1 NADH dehydrogenase subunit 4L [Arthrobotrys musiformis]QBM31580.1 NADH dehydrogenase subunit 4L [Arthrobotrys musiformis]QBM31656.1 NADH dehydrogenase subunit 4L [Arthrobotrys musiformis]QID02748.1 NADH dehydrogenase subunit 4L [Orbilia oligospora]